MNITKELIVEMKTNDKGWYALSEEMKAAFDVLRKDGANIYYRRAEGWGRDIRLAPNNRPALVYRLDKDYVFEEGGRYVEYAVKRLGWGYCIVNEESNLVSDLSYAKNSPKSLGLFGGVQFEGQHNEAWYMRTACGIDDEGYISPILTGEDEKPAIPIRVRFWVEG